MAKEKEKRMTIKSFLREVYKKDKHIGNDRVLQLVLSKFPCSKATYKTVLTWKKELRVEGIDIPKQKAGAKAKSIQGKKPVK